MKEMTSEEVKQIGILTLEKLSVICNKHNIAYWLAYGTLLGCIRHSGFIPWDDDIDVIMPRPDYERFCSLQLWNESPETHGIRLVTANNTSDYFRPYARLNDVHTQEIHKIMKDYIYSGVGVDVFPIDGLSNKMEYAKKTVHALSLEMQLVRSSLYKNPRMVYTDEKKRLIRFIKYVLSHSSWKNRMMLHHMEFKATCHRYKNSLLVGYAYDSFKDIMSKDIFSKSAEGLFEGNKYPIPCGYNQYLTNLYGDYMTPPPIEKRMTHPDAVYFWREGKYQSII